MNSTEVNQWAWFARKSVADVLLAVAHHEKNKEILVRLLLDNARDMKIITMQERNNIVSKIYEDLEREKGSDATISMQDNS